MGYSAKRKASRRLRAECPDAERCGAPFMMTHDSFLAMILLLSAEKQAESKGRPKQTPEGVILVSGKLGSRDAKYTVVDVSTVPHPIAKTGSWDFWNSIGRPRFVCAPMVEQSELAFRILCRYEASFTCIMVWHGDETCANSADTEQH